MKREDITKVFPDASKEQIDELLNIHSADIGKAKNDADTLRDSLAAANATITQLRETVGKFDGVDVEKLKNSVKDWETKYRNDTEALKLSAAIDREVAASGARNPRLLSAALDRSKIQWDGETAKGLSEQLETIKKSDPYLFSELPKGFSSGFAHGEPVPDLAALSDAEYYSLTMKKST